MQQNINFVLKYSECGTVYQMMWWRLILLVNRLDKHLCNQDILFNFTPT